MNYDSSFTEESVYHLEKKGLPSLAKLLMPEETYAMKVFRMIKSFTKEL